MQAGVLEIHPWGASLSALEQPDLIIMDLDPGEAVSWPEVIAAAIEVRERLTALGMTSFVKTSGGKGLHVVAPLQPKADWPAVKAFTKAMAEAMAADSPERFVATVTKSKRHGKILVDYLSNGRGATAVAPYSTRARPARRYRCRSTGTSSVPAWGLHISRWRIAQRAWRTWAADPWADFRRAAVPLPAAKSGRKRPHRQPVS